MYKLYENLKNYSTSGIYPFHMPGHKRKIESLPQWNPWQIDLTEVEGTDNLYHAEGILKAAMDRAAFLWKADRSYFLINGSTGGILSAVGAVVRPGDMVLVARNCHKSVYHAIFLNQLKAVYVYPEWIAEYGMAGGISPKKVEMLLQRYPQIRAVILTSPTYEGIVSDIGAIAEVVHHREIALIVDEAHGAHFNQAGFPESAVSMGADLVVQSCHKTLPALTQTGLLHLKSSLIDRGRLREMLSIYQTSSPSYLLMASIDAAVAFLNKEHRAFVEYERRLDSVREEISKLSHISIPGREFVGKYSVYHVDNSKIILSVCGKARSIYNGKWLYEKLRCEYKLQCEMAMEWYALIMTSVMDTEEGYLRLLSALKKMDIELDNAVNEKEHIEMSEEKEDAWELVDMSWERSSGTEPANLTIAEAFYAEKEVLSLALAEGRISGEYLYLYPPGIPLLAPGERISSKLIDKANVLIKQGFELYGQSEEGALLVCKEMTGDQ